MKKAGRKKKVVLHVQHIHTHTQTHTDIQLKVSFKSWTAAFVPEVVQKTPIHISHKQMKAHPSISISLAILRLIIFCFFTDKHTSKQDF